MWNSRKTQPPLKLHCFAAHAGVWSVKKKMRIPGSLSLSLSRESEREERRKSESESWLAGSHPGLPYRPHAYQPPLAPHRPWPTLSARRVSTTPAYPIGRTCANRPGLPYRAAACRPSYPIGPTRTVWACIGRRAPRLQRSSSVPS